MMERTVVNKTVVERTVVERTVVETTSGGKHLSHPDLTSSHQFFLSLYGHKLPVTSMDISSDNTLLITGSADKNVKIWGLDFGDCHKSIFAHDEA